MEYTPARAGVYSTKPSHNALHALHTAQPPPLGPRPAPCPGATPCYCPGDFFFSLGPKEVRRRCVGCVECLTFAFLRAGAKGYCTPALGLAHCKLARVHSMPCRVYPSACWGAVIRQGSLDTFNNCWTPHNLAFPAHGVYTTRHGVYSGELTVCMLRGRRAPLCRHIFLP